MQNHRYLRYWLAAVVAFGCCWVGAGGYLFVRLLAGGAFPLIVQRPTPTAPVVGAANATPVDPAPPERNPASPTPHPSHTPTDTAAPPTPSPTLTPSPTVPSPTPTLFPGETRFSPKGGVYVFVPAGEFLAGAASSDPQASSNERPQRTLYLDAFWINLTEVTNAMFAAFVETTGYASEAERGARGWVYTGSAQAFDPSPGSTWLQPGLGSTEAGPDYPVVQVTWNDARAYCQWVGGDLPTEAQWEKAARGPDGRRYPWGDDPATGSHANFAGTTDGYRFDAPAGSFPAGASPYGVLDLSGNLWEWVLDHYGDSYYRDRADGERNPYAERGSEITIRGGSWFDNAAGIRATYRYHSPPNRPWVTVSFRCAYPAAP